MLKGTLIGIGLILGLSASDTWAQNTNTTPTVRPRTATAATNTNKSSTDAKKSTDVQKPATTQPAARPATPKPKIAPAEPGGSTSVAAAFNTLINGIRKADVNIVSSIYWNSPRLILFNNNGSVTKGWEQMRRNRESSYRDMKDIKLDIRDLSIQMLGRDGAVVSCLWTQSQTYRGAPETASGRMTLVFKRVGKDWKAIHLHTSPDRAEPTRVLPSEQSTPSASSSPDR